MNAKMNGVRGAEIPPYRRLWAKTYREKMAQKGTNRRYHPLLNHMLDVAAVAERVWDECFAPCMRNRIEGFLGSDARSLLVFLAGAHDIGKASPGFQKRDSDLCKDSGLPFSLNDQSRPHGHISAHILNKALKSCAASATFAQIAGGHHGVFPRAAELCMGADSLGNKDWNAARDSLLQEFAQTIGFNLSQPTKTLNEPEDPALVPILAGFISVVDWIGSNQEFFPCIADYGSLSQISASDYWKQAKEKAHKALEQLGWVPAVEFGQKKSFGDVFKGYTPNEIQSVAVSLVERQNSPYFMIVEAPMGQGKTEAALYGADMAMCRGFARGMYIAMPTQATGNAMFKRVVDDYLKDRGHKGKLNVQLVHGDALLAAAQAASVLAGEIAEFNPQSIEEHDDTEESVSDKGDVEAQSWFTAKKRPLLAPFGIGTIDQSLLSVLQTKHWFVRLFGLAGKVVIFDEVHAYDAYMSTILERLLHWLAEVGCTVILLSATLPDAKRKGLAQAYSGCEDRAEQAQGFDTVHESGQVAEVTSEPVLNPNEFDGNEWHL